MSKPTFFDLNTSNPPYASNLPVLQTVDPGGYKVSVCPSLGHPAELHSTLGRPWILQIKDRRFTVLLALSAWDEPDSCHGTVMFSETSEELTETTPHTMAVPSCYSKYDWVDNRAPEEPCTNGLINIYGQPSFCQGEYIPALNKDGSSPYHHLLTIYNNWNDSGNINLFVHLTSDGYPEAAYLEASAY
jgi:hypothetical protein